MRVTAVFEESRMALDVNPEDTVKSLRKKIKSKMVVETMEDKKVGKVLEVRFGGAPLQDNWVLQDIAVTSGSVVRCALKTVEKAKLNVYTVYNEGNLAITDDINPITMTVGELRSILSSKLGIPVSVFRLSFNSRKNRSSPSSEKASKASRESPSKRANEIYDSNTLDYYGIEVGSKIVLDLWDGWNELIQSAIAGHEKTVAQYFSWERPVRHFQQRAALYIASFHGHMGLATAMMKYGAKGHEPVGMHPYRKWCFESEHPETKKCPLHVACVKGHLPILRLFIKSSPLCFITKDEQGRIPMRIVLRHKHKACFEFIIARQWGRKSGKDFSFTLTLYCRILQWCERAKARTLLMLGVNKSTLRGLPEKEGALVGTSVIVDGFSKKPANSVPYALIPKPAVSPEKMISVIALTKRRMRAIRRRQSSSRILSRHNSAISVQSSSRINRLTSAETSNSIKSYTSLDKSQSSFEQPLEMKFSHEQELLSNGNIRTPRKSISTVYANTKQKNQVTPRDRRRELQGSKATLSKVAAGKVSNDVFLPAKSDVTFPAINGVESKIPTVLGRKDSRISFKPIDISNSEVLDKKDTHRYPDSTNSKASLFSQPPPAVKRPPPPFQRKVTETEISLPSKSLERQMKPFFYWSPCEQIGNPIQETMQRFETYRGEAPRHHAVKCLGVTSSFTEKTWLQQLRMAVCLTKREVKRNVVSQSAVVISG